MSRTIGIFPGVAAFLAGVAAGALAAANRREGSGANPAASESLKRTVASLEAEIGAQKTDIAGRLKQIEMRLDEHAAKLADVPSTSQIVTAMEQLLSKTMSSLDERLTSQAHSIDTMKTAVAQTDSLLERVLESLDSLQTFSDRSEFGEDFPIQQLPA